MKLPKGGAAEGGVAIVFALLLMLALALLGHGALVATLADEAASRAAVRQLEARAAAEGALRVGLAATAAVDLGLDSVAVWRSVPGPTWQIGRARAALTLRRLGGEDWLVESDATLPGGARSRTAALAWSVDALTRVLALRGVVTVGQNGLVAAAGAVDASQVAVVHPPLAAGDCDPWLASIIQAYQQGGAPGPVATLAGDSTGALPLGRLGFAALLTEAGLDVSGSGTPGPTDVAGTCTTTDPWNWGDPDQPWRPCGAYMPLVGSGSDVIVAGGTGQGVLVVDGGVTLAGGAVLRGMVVASGTLSVLGGSRLEGMALAAGGLSVEAGSEIVGSACWAVRALAVQKSVVDRLRPVRGGERIGPL